MLHIPDLLRSLPAPMVETRFLEDEKLTLSVERALELRQAYNDQVSTFLHSGTYSFTDDVLPTVDFGLRLFNAENFSGELSPAEREHVAEVYQRFGATEAGSPKELYIQRLLTTDGEMPNACVRLSGLLLCLLAVMAATADDVTRRYPLSNLWRLRVQFRHQLCLMHQAHSIFKALSSCMDALMLQPEEDITVEQLIEVAHVQSYYHHRELATETLRRAMLKSGLQLEENAMMGVRTRWQQHQLVQMVLNARSTRPVPDDSTTEDQPVTVMAEKDGHDILDRPRDMPDAKPLAMTSLHPEDKAIILALCMDIRNSSPYHGLTQHHMQTYIERLVADPAPSPFMIRSQILLVRARLESNRNRVQERAFMQMTELVDQHSALRDPHAAHWGRSTSTFFYSVAFPPVWALQSELADFCFEATLYKTALDLYERVLDWAKIMECCKKLDKRKRAESLARDLLAKDPNNPMLWVALGEATREDSHLWKAWELSGHRMAAPMRSLARLALEREHYDKVVQYFDEAVRINPVFGGDWFTLGFASLKLQKWGRSGEAFTRVCQIDPSDAFAWNNLASVMLRENRLRPAFNAMSQALRNNRRDWRMWQNYLRIGCQLKEVSETTNALNIALDIAKRSIRLDRETMDSFVSNTIAYLRGEIPGSSADAKDVAEAMTDTICYRSMTAGGDPDGIEHVNVGAECEEVPNLVPLGADEDLSPAEVYDLGGARAGSAFVTINPEVLKRHGERVRALFVRILDTFVSDPDLYHAAARYFRYLDGPMAAYTYRVKELRACRQKDQWERHTDLFERTVECLQHMAEDAFAAFEAAQKAAEDPAGIPRPSSADRAAAAGTADEPAAQQEAVVCALKDTLNNVKAALEASAEYLEGTPSRTDLNALSARLRRSVQEAKAIFV